MLTKETAAEKAAELEEIMEQMAELISQAREVLCGTGMIERRAEAYWLGHMDGFLTDTDRSCTSVPDTINELRELDEEDNL